MDFLYVHVPTLLQDAESWRNVKSGLVFDSFGGIYLAENATKSVAQKFEILDHSESIGSRSVHVEWIGMNDDTLQSG